LKTAAMVAMLVAAVGLPASAASPPKKQVAKLKRQLPLADDPMPLRGIPLRGETGVRLLVADKPPFVLDIDTGRTTPVRGIPSVHRGAVAIVGVGGRAAVAIAWRPSWRRGQLYAIGDNGASLSGLGTGTEVAPAAEGRSVWVKRFVRRSHCTLRRVRLDGRVTRTPRAFPCAWTIYPGGSLGLGVSRTRVIDPLTRRTVFRTPKNMLNMRLGIVAIAGARVVLEDGPGRDLTVMDAATGTQRRLAWPNTVGQLVRNAVAVDVRGRFVELDFGNPSLTSAAGQAFDVWVLDTETAKLTQLPDMPAFVALKRTNMAWTEDGRLVLLTVSGKEDMVAVWRPGQERLEVKTLRLPYRDDNGNYSFAILGKQQ
jgi:hypothetical protein